jgi:hypothetical protein
MSLTRRTVLGMAMAAAMSGVASAARGQSVVLFGTDSDPDMSLATLQLRKLFLGFKVVHDNHVLRPIRNRTDALLDSIFLQHVVAMTEEIYQRRLLELSLQQGRPRPLEVRTLQELKSAVGAAPHCISFAWEADVAQFEGARVIRTLWRA